MITWTFPNGKTTTSTNYQVVLTIGSLKLNQGVSMLLSLSTSITNKQTTSIDKTIQYSPSGFVLIGLFLIVIDSTYPPYVSL